MGCGQVSQDFCLWNDRPWKNTCISVYYSTSVYYIYIYICIMTISYLIICLSSYSLPVYMMPQSVC